MVTAHHYEVSDEDMTLAWSAFNAPHRVPPVLAMAREQLAQDTVVIEVV